MTTQLGSKTLSYFSDLFKAVSLGKKTLKLRHVDKLFDILEIEANPEGGVKMSRLFLNVERAAKLKLD